MWRLIAVIALLLSLVVFSSPAAGSCRAPASIQENAARAEAVVYGTVTQVSGSAVTDVNASATTLRVDRVLKGQVGGSVVRVFGMAGLSTIDYRAELGSAHVLYLTRRADGELETNACVGSHAGPPDASEVAFFGFLPSSVTPSATPSPDVEGMVAALSVIGLPVVALILAIVVVGFATHLITRRRRA